MSWIENTELFPKAACVTPFVAGRDGYIEGVSALEIGRLAMEIGAGRERKEDRIQPETGILLGKKTGDRVKKGRYLRGCITTELWTGHGKNGCIKPLYGAKKRWRREN